VISTRYLPTIGVLVAAALVPTIRHSYLGVKTHDGRTAAAIHVQSNGQDGESTKRSQAWVLENFSTTDFIERRYPGGLTLFVARSYDAKRLYHHPELAVAYGRTYDNATIVRPVTRPDIPLHVLGGADGTSVYALLFGERFVDDPFRFQLENALALLVRPRGLMTLFFVHSPTAYPANTVTTSPEAALVLSAIESFTAQPRAEQR
jgi:hypothetical protein